MKFKLSLLLLMLLSVPALAVDINPNYPAYKLGAYDAADNCQEIDGVAGSKNFATLSQKALDLGPGKHCVANYPGAWFNVIDKNGRSSIDANFPPFVLGYFDTVGDCQAIPDVPGSVNLSTLQQKAGKLGDYKYCVTNYLGAWIEVTGTGSVFVPPATEEPIPDPEPTPDPDPLPDPDPVAGAIVVDNADIGFTCSGTTTLETGGYNGDYELVNGTDATCQWRFENEAGERDIWVYYPQRGSSVTYYSINGVEYRISQGSDGERWNKIATATLPADAIIGGRALRSSNGAMDAVAITLVGVEPPGYSAGEDGEPTGDDGEDVSDPGEVVLQPLVPIEQPDYDCGGPIWGLPDCPEPEVTYKPQLKQYPYSVPNVCEAIHDETAPKVTLQDGELMNDAAARLAAITTDEIGGVIEIPWDVDTVQCDGGGAGKRPLKTTIRGIIGPNGDLPRFYCRSTQFPEGTVPRQPGGWTGAGSKNGTPTLLIENLHIDGYPVFLQMGYRGHIVVRNVYAHHGKNNGFVSYGTDFYHNREGKAYIFEEYEKNRLNLEVCGSELAYHGQGNGQHLFYMHSALGGAGDNQEWLDLGANKSSDRNVIVDNFLHDCNWSSCFKSVSHDTIVKGNKIADHADTDPTFAPRFSSMLIDVPACGNHDIQNNEMIYHRAGPIIGIRNRKPPTRGCDIPVMWDGGSWSERLAETAWLAYCETHHPRWGAEKCKAEFDAKVDADGLAGARHYDPKIVDGPWHTEEYWAALNGKTFFTTKILNNKFIAQQNPISPKTGDQVDKARIVQNWGTYPNYQSGFGSVPCYLPTPMTWYERSKVIMDGNTYIGFSKDQNYWSSPIKHDYQGKCPTVFNTNPDGTVPGPGAQPIPFEIGTNEVYQ